MPAKSIGEILKGLRESKGLLLREVASVVKIDLALYSKIERSERFPTKKQVIKLSKFFKAAQNEFIIAWLSDKLAYEVQDEEMGLKAMQVAEEKMEYNTISKTGIEQKAERKRIMELMQRYFKKEKRVKKAWVFGSFAREENSRESDIDIMVSYSPLATGTLLDYADIKNNLEQLLKRKVDLVEEGYIKPFANDNIQKDLRLIYG